MILGNMTLAESFLKWLLEATFLDDLGEDIIKVITGTGLETTDFSQIISSVLVPVAVSMIGVIWFLEMIEKFTQMNYGREHNMWQEFIMLGVKLVFAKAIIEYSPTIISALIHFGNDLIIEIGALGTEITGGGIDNLMEEITEAGRWEKITLMFTLIPLAFGGWLTSFVVKIAIYSRVLKLILLQTFSPIPLATLPFKEYSGMSRRFLQSFLGTVLQGAMIVVLLMLAQQISEVTIFKMDEDVSMIQEVVKALFMNVILAFSIFKSEAWSKEVVGLG